MSDSFWSQISQLSILMQPYCGALDKLQADKAKVACRNSTGQCRNVEIKTCRNAEMPK